VYAAPPPAAPPSSATLPCNPNVVNKNGVTYYQCGQTYYMQAYGSGGPIYMPVPPP
jgi:Meckel syndrome type 1 protein